MPYRMRPSMVAVLAMLFVVFAMSLAAAQTEQSVIGTLDKVDARTGNITLRTAEGPVQLQAPAGLLAGLQAGDVVEVKMAGNKATAINKRGAMQKPKQ